MTDKNDDVLVVDPSNLKNIPLVSDAVDKLRAEQICLQIIKAKR